MKLVLKTMHTYWSSGSNSKVKFGNINPSASDFWNYQSSESRHAAKPQSNKSNKTSGNVMLFTAVNCAFLCATSSKDCISPHGQHVKTMYSTRCGSLIKLTCVWMKRSASKICNYGLWNIHIRFKAANYSKRVWTTPSNQGIIWSFYFKNNSNDC
jgi:hypothetical protein